MGADVSDRRRAGEQVSEPTTVPADEYLQAVEADNRPDPDEQEEEAPRDPWEGLWQPVEAWGPWLTEKAPPRKWVVSRPREGGPMGVLPREALGILAAAGGVGKTWALAELVVLIAAGGTEAHGCHWLDAFSVAGGPVAWFAAEETPDEMWRRLSRVAYRWRRDRPGYRREDGWLAPAHIATAQRQLFPVPMAGRPDLALMGVDGTGGIDMSLAGWKLLQHMKQHKSESGWALVAIDPLARVTAGEIESSNMAATRAVQVLERFAALPGRPAVLAAHHTSQASRQVGAGDATAIRGVTGLSDASRFAATLTPLRVFEDAPEMVQFAVPKHNYSPHIPPVLLTRDEGVLRAALPREIEAYTSAKEEAERKAAEEMGRRRGQASAAAKKEREKALADD